MPDDSWAGDACIQSSPLHVDGGERGNLASQFAAADPYLHLVDQWHHFAVVIKGNELSHYGNGVKGVGSSGGPSGTDPNDKGDHVLPQVRFTLFSCYFTCSTY